MAEAVAEEVPKVEEENNDEIDDEIAEMENELANLEQEAETVKALETETKDSAAAAGQTMLEDGTYDTKESDERSIYVGNVDYGATPEELQEHFKSCGPINRLTIMVDKYTYTPKGFAYIEFQDPSGVTNASLLNDSLFRGRQLKVDPKRTNVWGFNKSKGKGKPKGKKGFGKGFPPAAKGAWGAPAWGAWGYPPAPKGKGKGKWGAPY